MRLRASSTILGTFLAFGIAAGSADAACTRLAFSVNDYGKVGPTKDAKDLLDKYIAKWTAERGIAKYTTGKKDVTCELFLDVGLFDEYTCKAAASVCWPGSNVPADAAAAAAEAKKTKSAAKPAAAAITTGTIAPAAKAAPAPKAAAPAAAPKPQ